MRKNEDIEAAGSRCFDALLARNAARIAIFLFAAGWAAAWAEEPQTTLRTGPPPFGEELPPIGTGQMLSEEQLAYCLAQGIRLDAVRPLVDRYRKAQVESFNALARDFTSRCGSYLYEGNARDVAKGLVEANRARVESDARAAYAERFPDEEKEAVESKPAPPQAAQRPEAPPAAQKPEAPAVAQKPEAPAAQKPETPAVAKKPEAPPVAQKPEAPPVAQKPEAPPVAQKPEAPPVAQKPEAPPVAQKPEAPPVAQKPEAPPVAQKPEAPPVAQKPEAPPAAQKPEKPAAQKPETPTVGQKVEAASSAPPSPSQAKPSPAPPPSVAVVESQPSKPQQPVESKPVPSPLPPVKLKQEADADAILERYAKEIRKLGSRVLDQRDYVDALSSKRDVTTEIEVRYAAGGYIRSIDLRESSGSEVLDQTALSMCRSMRFPRVPEELHSRDFTVRFPIVFRAPKPG